MYLSLTQQPKQACMAAKVAMMEKPAQCATKPPQPLKKQNRNGEREREIEIDRDRDRETERRRDS